MATRTVGESDGKRKCEEERDEARRELDAAMARFAAAELSCSDAGTAPAALLDRRLRTAALESALRGLRLAYGKDDAAPGPCPGCGGASRLCRRERSAVDTALGRVSMEMARRSCRSCGRSWRPRQRLLGIEGSMTPTARRLASLAGLESSCAKADGLLRELSELRFGAKRIERATRAAGADLEAWRSEERVGAGGVSLSSEASRKRTFHAMSPTRLRWASSRNSVETSSGAARSSCSAQSGTTRRSRSATTGASV